MKTRFFLFWDYDTQWGGDRSRSGGPQQWGGLEFENTELLLDVHAEYHIRSCFAVVGAAALSGDRPYHDPSQIRKIHEAGHEVGSHSFRHEWLPGLTHQEVRETLRLSKDALEQCIGAPVVSFVPPYNQPYDFPERGSFSLSERREARVDRTDVRRLCESLHETGYRFCRLMYRPIVQWAFESVLKRRLYRTLHPEQIAGIHCVRLNNVCGFTQPVMSMLERCVRTGGTMVAYGHPHSVRSGNSQDVSHLRKFFEAVDKHQQAGVLQVMTPSDYLQEFDRHETLRSVV